MIETWDQLKFWKSGEWQVIQERLDDWKKKRTKFCPDRELVFAALDEVPLCDVKAILVGQDPYPDKSLATGVAFSIPAKVKEIPPTLKMIFKEYQNDLHHDLPKTGDLSAWCGEGVLLWNSLPTCYEGKSLSHNFPEYHELTREVVSVLNGRGVVHCFLGSLAREFSKCVDTSGRVIETSHPSPRGNRFSKQPFLGSRIFSRINAELVSLGKPTINWRLP